MRPRKRVGKAAWWRPPVKPRTPLRPLPTTPKDIAAAKQDALQKQAHREREAHIYRVTLNGREYKLDFSLDSLAEGERDAFVRQKEEGANMMTVWHQPAKISSIRTAFAISLHRFHPEIPFAAAKSMINFANIIPLASVIFGELAPTSK